jgi:MFS family permease
MAGYASAATILGFFVGPVSGGWLANVVGISGVFMIAAGIAVTCAVAAAVLTRRLGGPPPLLPLPEHQAPR